MFSWFDLWEYHRNPGAFPGLLMAWLNGASLLHAQSAGKKYEGSFRPPFAHGFARDDGEAHERSRIEILLLSCGQPLKCDRATPDGKFNVRRASTSATSLARR